MAAVLDDPVPRFESNPCRSLLQNRYILKVSVLPVLKGVDPNRFGCHVRAACFRSVQENSKTDHGSDGGRNELVNGFHSAAGLSPIPREGKEFSGSLRHRMEGPEIFLHVSRQRGDGATHWHRVWSLANAGVDRRGYKFLLSLTSDPLGRRLGRADEHSELPVKELFRSSIIRGRERPHYDLDVTGVKKLELVVEKSFERNGGNWGLWLEPTLFREKH